MITLQIGFVFIFASLMASAHVLLFYCYPPVLMIELSLVKRNLSLLSDSKVYTSTVKDLRNQIFDMFVVFLIGVEQNFTFFTLGNRLVS